jgi:hypothetical protein
MRGASQADADALAQSYAGWRAACAEVESAYHAWERARPCERDVAFGGYLAALQQEQHRAHLYRDRLELLQLRAA